MMRRSLTVVLFLLCASLAGMSVLPSAQATVLYVGGAGPGNYTTIQSAIDNATTGDTVFVFSGTYFEHVLVNKSVSLIGESNETTVVDGMGDGAEVAEERDPLAADQEEKPLAEELWWAFLLLAVVFLAALVLLVLLRFAGRRSEEPEDEDEPPEEEV